MKDNKLNLFLFGLIGILIIAVLFLYRKNSNLNVKNKSLEQNKKALLDTIRVGKNKVGDLTFSKQVLISQKKDLEELNEDLREELKKEKGKVFQLSKIVASIKLVDEKEPIEVTNTVVEFPKGEKGLEWEFNKNYSEQNNRYIKGISKFSISDSGDILPLTTTILEDEINFNIIQGFREKDGKLEMFVRSDYPGFNVNDLNSAFINPNKHPIVKKFIRKKKFGLSVYGGYGSTIYDSKLIVGPQIGLGLHYKIIEF